MSGGTGFAARTQRVEAVIAAARRMADPHDPLGQEARAALPDVTGLSAQGVELGLTRHLETAATPSEIARLVQRCASAARVHVVLSANVFVAAARALALAAASSHDVVVRPSSRDPVVAELLARALHGGPVAVRLVHERALALRAGDHVHVYGRQTTIDAIAAQCSSAVTLQGHGPGCGVALVDGEASDLTEAARALSWDVVAFDQRGCLSPRVAFVVGAPHHAEGFAALIADELAARADAVPRGRLHPDEVVEHAWYRRTLQTTGTLYEHAAHLVGCDSAPRALTLPPTGRCLHVVRVTSAAELQTLTQSLAPAITCIGAFLATPLLPALQALAPGARTAPLGEMQRPPLDGPVDLRSWYRPTR